MPLGLSGSGEITGFDPTASGFGKVLKIVEGTSSSNSSLATTTFTDIGLSASITPSATSNKIFVIAFLSGLARIGTITAAQTQLEIKVLRNSTDIYLSPAYLELLASTQSGASYVSVPGPTIVQLDSPSTTSATTYKLQARNAATATDGVRILAPMRLYLIEVAA